MMYINEIETALYKLLQRDDLDSYLRTAINLGHQQMQLDHQFRGQEAHDTLTFTSADTDGVAVPADFVRARKLWSLTAGGAKDELLQPSTEAEIDTIHTMEYQYQVQAASDTTLQRWWEEELQIHLLFLPSTATDYRLDYHKLLPDLTDLNPSDHLSQFYPEALILAGAWRGSVSLWEDERAGVFERQYMAAMRMAIETDKKLKQGGAYDSYSPPMPGSGRR